MRFPATAPIPLSRAPACAAESPKLSLPGAAPGRLANVQWGRGRRVMHLPCKQTQAGALPAASTNFSRGENEIQASPISLASVGATPTPATTACAGPPREVIRLPDCKSGVAKQSRKRRTGALPALPTISGSVAQLAERPVVCGRVEGATPFGSAIFSECSSVFRAPGLGPGGRR